jgi:sugar lactone lactonase YvrE
MRLLLCAMCFLAALAAFATETENREIRVLPTPGPVTIDGKIDDWDLSGGIFGCDDVENARDRTFIWFHTMADANYLYVLGRLADSTPMNNRLSKAEGGGWGGDCLQVRLTTDRNLSITAWRDRDGLSVMDIYYGYFSKTGKEGEVPDAIAAGAKMAFQANPDGKGYVQEIALPWQLITRSGTASTPGQTFRITFETRQGNKIGDLYAPKPDRIFTFRAFTSWGIAKVSGIGNVAPQPVRLADGREFPVTLHGGQPKVNWDGLIVEDKLDGHIPITVTVPRDSYVTVAINDAQATRVRNLVSSRFFTAGTHTLQWDGLADGKENLPGKPVPPGRYTWKGLAHDQLHLEYKGIYHNEGQPPWSNFSAANDWGGDHGQPVAAVAGTNVMYLGWSGGEASTQLIAVNLDGKKLWGARRGYSSTEYLCLDGTDLYSGPNNDTIYRLDAKTGAFKAFPSTGLVDLTIPLLPGQEKIIRPSGMAALNGKLFLSFAGQGQIARLDVQTGKYDQFYPVETPGRLAWTPEKRLLVISGTTIRILNPATGVLSTLVADGLMQPKGLAAGADGAIYVADWGLQQVKVFTADGKIMRTLGRPGGRAAVGPWQKDGFYRPQGMAVDAQGRLWVGEYDETPKRWSVWTADGTLVKELFGPSHYGSDGGALNPDDPYLGVGEQCEWRTHPGTGRAICLGTISRDGMCNVPFPLDAHSSRYLKVGNDWYLAQGLHRYYSMLKLYRKLGDGHFRLAAVLGNAFQMDNKTKKPLAYSDHPLFAGHKGELFAWADADGDGQVQAAELTFVKTPAAIIGGWQQLGVNADFTAYMPMTDGTIWRFPVDGMTKAGAPLYALAGAKSTGVKNAGGYSSVMPSIDGDLIIVHSNPLQGADPLSGKTLWTYPNDYNGVHGSHKAPTPKVGLLRGTFAVVGSAKLKSGEELFMINSNVGEWYSFTKDGLFVANHFALNPVDVRWPEKAEPGVLLDAARPGMGGEDFGGHFTGTKDGRAFLQCGKTGYWIVELTGVDSLSRLPGGTIEQPADGVAKSQDWYSKRLQQTAGVNATTAHRFTPTVDGKLIDWTPAWLAGFDYNNKGEANNKAAVAYDETHLYLAYQVVDRTPWKNTCTDPTQVYALGDTVDFQLGTNPQAPAKRAAAVPGDLRLAIGNVNGKPTAVVYREKGPALGGNPAMFSSGVIRDFRVESVAVLTDATIRVVAEQGLVTVEAAIPLARLGLTPTAGLTLPADFGVTFGNADGTDVVLRKYWSNQNVAIVNDEVFELKLEPRNWGTLKFE